MRVHASRFQKPNGTYSVKYYRVPQVQGQYLISEIKEASTLELSFQNTCTEKEKAIVLKRWKDKTITVLPNLESK